MYLFIHIIFHVYIAYIQREQRLVHEAAARYGANMFSLGVEIWNDDPVYG